MLFSDLLIKQSPRLEHAETKQTAVTMVHAKTIDVNAIQDMTIKTTQIVQVSCIKRSNLIFSKYSIVH